MNEYTVTIQANPAGGYDVYIDAPSGNRLKWYGAEVQLYPSRLCSDEYSRCFHTRYHWWAQARAKRIIAKHIKASKLAQKQESKPAGTFKVRAPE